MFFPNFVEMATFLACNKRAELPFLSGASKDKNSFTDLFFFSKFYLVNKFFPTFFSKYFCSKLFSYEIF